jgi:N-acetylglucosaminyldiphosphoundecaprenol N-acetyl-beta-D-mannosaminyltransferase
MRHVESRRILGVRVDATDYARCVRQILRWAAQEHSRYICFGTVSAIMGGYDSRDYREALDRAALVTSDGMPLVWLLRWLGVPGATRVYGPDLMPLALEAAASAGIAVGFYGGTETTLARLLARVRARFPNVNVAYANSPPFRPLTAQEDAHVVDEIARSGTRILFVGLGSPKQDFWMHAHAGRIHAVMLGVGAAFDFLAGTKPQAPRWMQRSGLEWLFRLAVEPKRLWRRYLQLNPRFVVLALGQLLRTRLNEHRRTT